ncbi:MAG: DUF3576 domain-containing protein [Alphaproteobacteria bacterium]|nr:DUF3576 domain-containing protein [Alphaproteobacteria bacterium]MBL6938866.1 DUF3576 domain-containing protein [Alphaproteobacteria bacterium]MBL7099458.1 DUF3576 domain-containing protein [Alphaproteobacteria bacterium]
MRLRMLSLFALALILAGCSSDNSMPETAGGSTAISGTRTLGVNSYLWHATLDTLAFIPLASADPFGGVVITDWYTAPQAPTERMKVTVYILDRNLRADGIKVAVFRQTKDPTGVWADAPVANDTSLKLEDAILTRARELRLASGGS